MFAFLKFLAKIGHVFGSMMYMAFFRDVETRSMVFFAIILSIFSCFMSYALAERWNLQIGVPDLVMLILSDAVLNVNITIMYVLPI